MASTDKIHLNLDEVQRPEDQQFEVFATVINGRRIEISDPAEIDYKDLLTIDTPLQFFRYTMSEDDRNYLAEQNLKGWRLGLLLEGYLKHYRAEERIDQRLEQRKRLGF